jgi:2-polyprenyl-3-methyl-5-hydroxy-6-metoxy-1,4-benzoquinol methylase
MKCIVCESGNLTRLPCTNQTFTSDGEIFQCASCLRCMVQPLPDLSVIKQFYISSWSNDHKDLGWMAGPIFNLLGKFHMRLKSHFRYPSIEPYLKKDSKILEVGPGDGSLCRFLRGLGYKNIYAIEPSAAFRSKLMKQGFHVLGSKIEDLDKHNIKFDVCLAFHVLEHLSEPLAFLTKLKKHLEVGGVLLGEVPNVPYDVSIFSDAMKKSIFDNAHLFHYSCKGLQSLFERLRFKQVECEEVGLNNVGIRRFFPKANCHLIHPSFDASRNIKFLSLFHAAQSYFNPKNSISIKKGLKVGFREPNDFIYFKAALS